MTNSQPRRAAQIAAGAIIRALAGVGEILVVAILVLIVTDVVRRNLGVRGIPGAVELSTIMLVGVAYLSRPNAELRGDQIRVTIFTDRLKGRARRVSIAAGTLVSATITAVWAVAAFVSAAQSTKLNERDFGLIPVPIWPARWAIFVSLAGFCVATLIRFSRSRDEPGIQEIPDV